MEALTHRDRVKIGRTISKDLIQNCCHDLTFISAADINKICKRLKQKWKVLNPELCVGCKRKDLSGGMILTLDQDRIKFKNDEDRKEFELVGIVEEI